LLQLHLHNDGYKNEYSAYFSSYHLGFKTTPIINSMVANNKRLLRAALSLFSFVNVFALSTISLESVFEVVFVLPQLFKISLCHSV
jgi:hypothetical protein